MLFALALLSPAHAQETVEIDGVTHQVKFKERTELKFDEVDVNGSTTKPAMALVAHTGPADDFNPLIRLRKSFDAEMITSVDRVK